MVTESAPGGAGQGWENDAVRNSARERERVRAAIESFHLYVCAGAGRRMHDFEPEAALNGGWEGESMRGWYIPGGRRCT